MTHRARTVGIVLAAAIFAGSWLVGRGRAQDQRPPAADGRPAGVQPAGSNRAGDNDDGSGRQHREALRDAAKQAYQQLSVGPFGERAGSVEVTYIWSRRWADADAALAAGGDHQARTAARQGHLDRMRSLAKLGEDRVKAGVGGMTDATATRYYVLEAEGMVREGGQGGR